MMKWLCGIGIHRFRYWWLWDNKNALMTINVCSRCGLTKVATAPRGFCADEIRTVSTSSPATTDQTRMAIKKAHEVAALY